LLLSQMDEKDFYVFLKRFEQFLKRVIDSLRYKP